MKIGRCAFSEDFVSINRANLNFILNLTGSQCNLCCGTKEHVRSRTRKATRVKEF